MYTWYITLHTKLSLLYFDKQSIKFVKKVLKEDKEGNKWSCTVMENNDSDGQGRMVSQRLLD